MAVEFTQYCLPNGRRMKQRFHCAPEIEAIAARFIASGGRYECEVLRTGEISLTAVKEVNGEDQDVALVLCKKGDEGTVGDKVNELIRQSKSFIGSA